MPAPVSAVDVIAPAFQRTKRLMFQPFRWGSWARLAVVSLFTGEFASGGWSGPSSFNIPPRGKSGDELAMVGDPALDRLMEFLPWIPLGVVALVCLWIILIYIESVLRFVLFDAVLRARYELSQGWRRWRQAGRSYFLWQMALNSVELSLLAVLVGVPLFLALRAGVFKQPADHLGLFLVGGMLLFFAVGVVVLAGALASFFAKDFIVPVMAMENVRVLEGWRRLLPMLAVEKMAFAGYVLMKIVLSVGSAIFFGIINVILFLILLIPLGAGGAALVLLGKAGGLSWDVYTISAAVILGVAALAAAFYLAAFVSAPGTVFSQAYTLQFLGSRYAPLGAALAEASASGPAPLESPGAP